MIISKSITKKYTPPTCTLEVVAKTSLLSRWSKQPLVKDLRFQLRFDDPRKPQEEQVTLSGDHLQLEMLCEVVDSYVQDFLEQSPLNSPNLIVPNVIYPSPLNSENALNQVEEEIRETGDSPPNNEPSEQHQPNLIALPSQPSLQGNYLAHQLFFGNLATEASGGKVNLSALQLFDLATALDEYSGEMSALPITQSSQRQTTPITWASVAAVALLSVGLTTAVLRLTNQSLMVAESSSEIEELETALGDSKSDNMTSITLPEEAENFPIPTPTLPSSLAQEGRLPLPTRVIAPPPSIPNPSPDNTSIVAPRSSSSTLTQIPTPEIPAPPPGSIPASPVVSGNSNKSLPPAPPVASPSPLENTTQARSYTPPEEPKQLQSDIIAIPTVKPKIPNNLPSLNANRRGVGGADPSIVAASPESIRAVEGSNNDSDVIVTPSTAITPVAQAQSYFQERWQPPEDLNQALEYRLVLNTSGSIERIIPLGIASRDWIDRTPMPVLGEAFVTGFTEEEVPQIRVVFKPDGSVETYGE